MQNLNRKPVSINDIILFISVFTGLFLLLYKAGEHNLWIDEAFSLRMASKSIKDLLSFVAVQDPHPPLYYILLKLWCGVFGFELKSAVYFSVFFGFLAGISGCYLYKLLFDKHPWTASIFIFCSPFFIMYSRMIRYYSLASFFVVIFLILYLKFLKSNNIKWTLFLAGIHIVLIYCDYPASTIFSGEFLAVILFYKKYRDKILRLILIYIVTIVSFSPWVSQLFYHIGELSKLPGADRLSGDIKGIILRTFFTLYDFSFGECIYPWNLPIIIPLASIIVAAAYSFISNFKQYPKNTKESVIVTMITVFSSLATGIFLANLLVSKQSFIYMPARLMFCFIPFIVIIAEGINCLGKLKYILVAVAVGLYSLVLINYYKEANYINPLYFIKWNDALSLVCEKYETGDIVISDEPEVVNYYAGEYLNDKLYLEDEKTFKNYFNSKNKDNLPGQIRIFLLLTERDSTGYSYFSSGFIKLLLTGSEIVFTKEYAKVDDNYFKIKKSVLGKSYKYKMKLYVLKVNMDLLLDYFRE